MVVENSPGQNSIFKEIQPMKENAGCIGENKQKGVLGGVTSVQPAQPKLLLLYHKL